LNPDQPDNANVRVYVQRPDDGWFAKTRTEWVRERADAKCFQTAVDALVFSIAARLERVRLIVLEAGEAETVLYPFGQKGRTIRQRGRGAPSRGFYRHRNLG